ncbi:MAG: YigZ family protein [Clostridia bacterium]|nr:YigZ family protein [Clostridia bacterium]
MEEYRTIRQASSDEFVEKKSRFIGYICPVTTQEEALDFIQKIKSKHWDATHNVYAYVLRDGQTRRYSDDGEPQGTAGIPVLDVLLKENLVDCAVVVTRYFGGIMLGAGGLVRAYSHGSKIAVDAGGIVTMCLCDLLTVSCDYNFYGRLSSLIPEMGGIIEDTRFTDVVEVDFRIPSKLTSALDEKLFDVSLGKYRCKKTGEIFSAVD